MGEELSRDKKAPSTNPRLPRPSPRSGRPPCPPTLSSMASSMPAFPVSRWTGRWGGGSSLSWNSHVIFWDIPWLPSTDMDPVGGGLLLQELWLPGFLCNVYTRNQFGKLIHPEQGSQKTPWKSSRVTPSLKRHRHRLAGCVTVKPGLVASGSVSPPWSTCKPEEDMSALPYSMGSRSGLSA